MNPARRLVGRLLDRVRRRTLDRRLEEELETHVQMLADDYVARGLSSQEARRRARLHLGGVEQTKEAVRDQRALWLESVWQDVRYGARSLRRNPGFAAVAIVTLALGIGANTAIFSIIDAVLLHPLPVDQPDRLVSFAEQYANIPDPVSGFLYSDFVAFRSRLRSFDGVAAEGAQLIGVGDEDGTRRATVLFVSSNYFQVVGVRPHLGRWFLPEEEREGAPPTTVLSYAAWRRWFGGDPGVIGKSLRLTGLPTTIVGVAPRGFQGTALGDQTDVFVPLLTAPAVAAHKDNFFSDHAVDTGDGVNSPSAWLRVSGRLRPGTSLQQAEAEARAIVSGGGALRHLDRRTLSFFPADRSSLFKSDRAKNVDIAWLLGGLVGLVLLVGCTGLAGLLLARTERRKRELAARLALGASRGRLLRQQLTETTLLVGIGCGGALVVARLMVAVLAQFPLPGLLAIEDVDPRLNGYALAFAIAVALLTALLCGVIPAWRGSFAQDVASSLKTVGRTAARGRSRLQSSMLVVQVALSLVLLVVGTLFVRSIQAGVATSLGFRPEGLVAIDLSPVLVRYDPQRAGAVIDELTGRLGALPGVQSVAVGTTPLAGFALSGRTLDADGQTRRVRPYVGICFVDRPYFRTLGIAIVRGRVFGRDDGAGTAPVAVINEALARALWPGQDALGRHITRLPVSGAGVVPQAEVVGIAANANVRLVDRGTPVLYLLRAQNPGFNDKPTTVTVRVSHDAASLAGVLRQQVRAVDRDLPVLSVATMDEQVERQLATQRLGAWLTGWFGLLALGLAVVGTYGIVAYSLARRTAEIGVRIALGAPPSRMPLLMLRVGLAPVLVGVVLGLVAAWPVTRLIKAFLFGVSPQDPVAFVTGAVLLATAAAGASYLAARRASRVSPVDALRAE